MAGVAPHPTDDRSESSSDHAWHTGTGTSNPVQRQSGRHGRAPRGQGTRPPPGPVVLEGCPGSSPGRQQSLPFLLAG